MFSTRSVRTFLVATLAMGASIGGAQAQTTLVLDAPGTQVTDVMIQAGASAHTNFNDSDMIATRASTNYDYLRRALVKFDTQNTMPAKSTIQSAIMTLTVKYAGADRSRAITVFPVTTSWVQEEATWNLRRSGNTWISAGGDLGPAALVQDVPNVVGAKVGFDVTALVRAAVSGADSSRYTRVALADLGVSTNNSYREYFSSKAIDPSVRPVLRIVYGGTATTSTGSTAATAPIPAGVIAAATCPVVLDKASLSVGQAEANWSVNVTAAAGCAWTVTGDADWLVVKSTSPAPAVASGYAKVRAVTNTVSASKRTGHLYVNGVAYTVTQGGCGSSCTGAPPPVVAPPVAPPPVVVPPPPGTAVTLRVLQYNTHHGGWGSDGVYSPDRIADWIVNSNADLVSLNEIEVKDSWSKNLDQSVVYQDLLQQKTGLTWYRIFVNAHGAKTGIGNLVLSKIPFIATAAYQLSDGRAAVDATVDVNGRTLNFTSVHLDSESAPNRIKEISELLPWAAGIAENRIVAGDFNAWPAAAEITTMKATYIDTWPAAQALGTAIGNGITHGTHRIDYIFQSKGTTNLTLVSEQIYATADANGVTPSDHQPMLAVFEVR
ncbi:MAG: DNRLRE domain-containing protein [Vicinamibacterales bacterium]